MIIVKNRKRTDSKSNEWGTPFYLFDELNKVFNFTIDLCASEENKKLDRFYSKEQNSLEQSWDNETGWLNPPYGAGLIEPFLKKASEAKNSTIVALVPASTAEGWWWNTVQGIATANFIKGRVKFEGAKHSAGFGSAILVYSDLMPYLTNILDLGKICENVHNFRKRGKK